jgi:hypothetical protein
MADKQELIPNDNQGDVIIYQAEDGKTKIKGIDGNVYPRPLTLLFGLNLNF